MAKSETKESLVKSFAKGAGVYVEMGGDPKAPAVNTKAISKPQEKKAEVDRVAALLAEGRPEHLR